MKKTNENVSGKNQGVLKEILFQVHLVIQSIFENLWKARFAMPFLTNYGKQFCKCISFRKVHNFSLQVSVVIQRFHLLLSSQNLQFRRNIVTAEIFSYNLPYLNTWHERRTSFFC